MVKLESWVISVLADPITKQRVSPEHFPAVNGVLDARVFLKNTYGYGHWAEGQSEYERWAESDQATEDNYRKEIAYDRPIYEHFTMSGRILDCGGGLVRCASSLPTMLNLFPSIHGSKRLTLSR